MSNKSSKTTSNSIAGKSLWANFSLATKPHNQTHSSSKKGQKRKKGKGLKKKIAKAFSR
jgi:hypothetical protein